MTAGTSERQMLRDAVARFVQGSYDPQTRRKRLRDAAGEAAAHWRAFVDNGWVGAGLSEEAGGFGGGPEDIAAIAEELGRGLAVEPYVPNMVGARLIVRAGSEAQHAQAAAMVAGEARLAIAFAEPQSRYDLADCLTTAKVSAGGYRLDGTKVVVLGGDVADRFVVVARSSGGQRDDGGISLFLVPRAAPGLSISPYRLVDERGACDLRLDGVELGPEALLGRLGEGLAPLQTAIDEATALSCAETIGVMAAAFDTTLDYTKQRVQFGQPIGSNQVLQHRLVDMHIRLREAEALTRDAVAQLESDDATARALAVSAAKIHAGRAARLIGQETVQLHGGIGTTDEAQASHYFKRLTGFGLLFGDVDHHEARFGRLSDRSVQVPAGSADALSPHRSAA